MQQLQKGDSIYVFNFQDISTEKSEVINYLKEINDKKASLYWSHLFNQIDGLSLNLGFTKVDIPHFVRNYRSNESIEIIKLVYHRNKKLMDYINSREKEYYDMHFNWCAQSGLSGYDAEVTCPRSQYLGW